MILRAALAFGVGMAALGLMPALAPFGGTRADAAEWTRQFPKFRYGVQPVETAQAAQARYRGFGEYLKKKFGVTLELFLAPDYAGIIRALGNKQIEVMDMGAAGYATAWLESKGAVEPLVVPTNPDGTIGYYAVAIVRSDSPYKSVADLRGKTWAWVDPNSSSGYLFPQVSFRKLGLDPARHFGSVVFSGGHEQSVIGVLDKTYDAAVTWTNDIQNHTRGGLQMLLSRGVLTKEDIRIIWVSDLIPNPVITTRTDLPKEMKDDIKAMFLNLRNEDPEVFQAVARGESRGYVEVKHDVYQIAVDLSLALAREQRGR
jgi:phosphonate transport system substrate-binding protein